MKEITFMVEGMHCAACSAAVENALKKLGGVTSADVNIATNTAHLVYDEAVTGEADFIKTVKVAGFTANLKKKSGLLHRLMGK